MKILRSKHLTRILGLLVLEVLLFCTTNAATAPSFVAIVAYVLLVATIYYGIYGLIGLGGLYGLRVKRRRPLAIYMTVVFGLVVALQSIGELGLRDVMVIVPLALMGYLYSMYAKTTRSNLSG
jgi:hypothetical protein